MFVLIGRMSKSPFYLLGEKGTAACPGMGPWQGLFWGKWGEKLLSPAEAPQCRQCWCVPELVKAGTKAVPLCDSAESSWCPSSSWPAPEWTEQGGQGDVPCLCCSALPSHCQFCYPLGVSGSNFLAVSPQFNSFEEEERFINNWNEGIYDKIYHKSCPTSLPSPLHGEHHMSPF